MSALTGPLPRDGLLCVEASAGTGKTHQLSTLAVRWLVESEDVRVADLLIVTYTVAAAAELRGRVRERLAQVRDRIAPDAAPSDDAYLEGLAGAPDAAGIRERAVRALAEFDTATIRTIHAFAAGALGETRGVVGPSQDRRRQAVTDVLSVAAFDAASRLWDLADVTEESLGDIVGLGLDHPDLTLAPLDGADAPEGALSFRDVARRTIETVAQRQRRDGVLTYSDLLTELDDALRDDDAPLLHALRRRFRVGLIDEFQDTDAIQWRIFSRLFLDAPGGTLVVVGDPKQAIYGFRGADVDTYLAARDAAATTGVRRGLGVLDLETNYRSDGVLLDALNGLFDGTHFDEDNRIEYVRVHASPRAARRRLSTPEDGTLVPLSIRVPTWKGKMHELRAAIAEDCAEEAARALGGSVVGEDGAARALGESDIAVLCATRYQFPLLKEAFLRRGIRTTEAKSDDVLESPAALHVEVALRAMCDPSDTGAVAALAQSLFGTEASGVEATARAREQLAAWQRALEQRGVAALARAVCDPASTRGLLARRSGERLLTDVHHLFDLLAEEVHPGARASGLFEALQELRTSAREASDENTRARRIDTDAPAVRLMTVHGSKGLEFGVVLCPYIQQTRIDERRPMIWRDARSPGRILDAGGGEEWTDERLAAPTKQARSALVTSAAGGESRRLHYVALTRAMHRCVVWWLPAYDREDRRRDELAALLFDRDERHRPVQRPRAMRGEVGAIFDLRESAALEALQGHLAELCNRGLVEVSALRGRREDSTVRAEARDGGRAPAEVLGVARLGRSVAQRPVRCSFSSLVSGDHAHSTLDASVGDAGADDEGPPHGEATGDDDAFGGLRGTGFGSAVHEALEAALSRASGDFDGELVRALHRSLRRRSIAATDRVAEGLVAATSVPVLGGPALRDLPSVDVSTELRFALPVAAGVDLGAIGTTVAELDGGGPFADWAASLGGVAGSAPLAASLVGSIDLVTTWGTAQRYGVVDYKTNVCDPVRGGYGRAGLQAAMCDADYPLQAILYLVALHRYLRWRLADYDPARHLGGATYLFLRGMRADADDGIVEWSPSPAAVSAVSDLLAGTR